MGLKHLLQVKAFMMNFTANLVEDAQADSASSWGNRDISQAPDWTQALKERTPERPRRSHDPR